MDNKLDYKDNSALVKKCVMIFFGAFGIMTVIFMFTTLDVKIMSNFHNGENFFLTDKEPWKYLYEQEYGFSVGLVILVLYMLIISFVDRDKKDLRRYSWFLLATIVFGALILVNFIFKEYWGRPRPRETIPFGTEWDFFHLWKPAFVDILNTSGLEDPKDALSNSSFSAGHPVDAMGYLVLFFMILHPEVIAHYFDNSKKITILFAKILTLLFLIAGIYGIIQFLDDISEPGAYDSSAPLIITGGFTTFIIFGIISILYNVDYEKRVKILSVAKYMALGLSIIGGLLMGVGRIVQGGHWPSDVMYTYGFIMMSTLLMYYVFMRIPRFEKQNVPKLQDPAVEIVKDPSVPGGFVGFINYLGLCLLIVTPIWFVEYSISPDLFKIEFYVAIFSIIAVPILFFLSWKKYYK